MPAQDVEALLARLKDSHFDVRSTAAEAFGNLEPSVQAQHVEALLKDSEAYVRGAAARALGNLEPA